MRAANAHRLRAANFALTGIGLHFGLDGSLIGLDRELDDSASLHTVLRRRFGLTVVRQRYRIGFDVPPQRIADHLSDGDRGPVWLAESINRAAGGPVEYARTYLRPDVLDVAFEIGEEVSDR